MILPKKPSADASSDASSGHHLQQRAALDRLALDIRGLKGLGERISKYDMFSAVGMPRSERLHTNVLAHFLNPQERHGLRDLFLRAFLKTALSQPEAAGLWVGPATIEAMDLGSAQVSMEQFRTDVLVLDERNRFAIVLENKIDSGEHGNQLERYKERVESEFPHLRFLGFMLSPDKRRPSCDDYVPLGYDMVARVCAEVAVNARDGVQWTLQSYAEFLRRHIVDDSEIVKIAQGLYEKHKGALDIIFEHRPDRHMAIKNQLDELIQSHPELIADRTTKAYVNFVPKAWDSLDLKHGKGWTASGRMLMYEIVTKPSIRAKIVVGPGPSEIREALIALARQFPEKPKIRKLGKKWTTVFERELVGGRDLEELPSDELKERLADEWSGLVKKWMPARTQWFAKYRAGDSVSTTLPSA